MNDEEAGLIRDVDSQSKQEEAEEGGSLSLRLSAMDQLKAYRESMSMKLFK